MLWLECDLTLLFLQFEATQFTILLLFNYFNKIEPTTTIFERIIARLLKNLQNNCL
jgi:hypothetical protein